MISNNSWCTIISNWLIQIYNLDMLPLLNWHTTVMLCIHSWSYKLSKISHVTIHCHSSIMHWDHTFTFSLELHFQWFKCNQNFTQLSWFHVLWKHKLHVCIDSFIFGCSTNTLTLCHFSHAAVAYQQQSFHHQFFWPKLCRLFPYWYDW